MRTEMGRFEGNLSPFTAVDSTDSEMPTGEMGL
jgi:hypothetical protein